MRADLVEDGPATASGARGRHEDVEVAVAILAYVTMISPSDSETDMVLLQGT
jgi:hypothetical protein